MRTFERITGAKGEPTNSAIMTDTAGDGMRTVRMVVWTSDGATIIDGDGRQTKISKDGRIMES